jgi:hypothetical protein
MSFSGDEVLGFDGKADRWEWYKEDNRKELYDFLKLHFTLEDISDRLCAELVAGNPVNVEEALTFDENELFENRMQALFDDLATDDHEPQTPYAQRMKRFSKNLFGGGMILKFPDGKKARQWLSPAVGLLAWAKHNNISDPKLESIKKIITYMYHQDNLPRLYEDLVKLKFLGINLEDKNKNPFYGMFEKFES